MKKIVFAILIITLSFSCLFAGGKEEPAKPVEEVAVGPKYGGTLLAAVESEPLLLDNHLQMSNVIVAVSDVFNDFLWRWNKDFTEFVPPIISNIMVPEITLL